MVGWRSARRPPARAGAGAIMARSNEQICSSFLGHLFSRQARRPRERPASAVCRHRQFASCLVACGVKRSKPSRSRSALARLSLGSRSAERQRAASSQLLVGPSHHLAALEHHLQHGTTTTFSICTARCSSGDGWSQTPAAPRTSPRGPDRRAKEVPGPPLDDSFPELGRFQFRG